MNRGALTALVVLVALVVATSMACTDSPAVDPAPPGTDAGRDARADATSTPREPPSCEEVVGRPIVRRLTSTQLDNILTDLFASPDVPRADVLVDPVVRGYDVDANAAVIRDLGADRWMRAAEAVAAWAVPDHLDAITLCTDTGAVCQLAFIRQLGLRLYRRPLDAETVNLYVDMLIAEADFESGARTVLAAMLQSPGFLYRVEIGERVADGEPLVELGPFEVASALSFFLTNSAPDAELLAAAGEGRLVTEEDLDREFDRLVATPRARGALGHFARQWLLVDGLEGQVKDPAVTSFTDEVRTSMLRETEAFYANVFESGGGIAELFGGRTSFVDGPLGAFYGVAGVTGTELQSFDIDAAHRGPGALGQGSVLASHALADSSSPVQRGALVRRRFLCETLPPPPPSVIPILPPSTGAETTRERNLEHSQNPACAGCHRLMDPVGFALEHYDGFGRYRADENGLPIDATGEIVATPDGDVPLDGAETLSSYLASSPEARACFATNVAYYAFGVEGCTWASIARDLDADTALRDILRRVVHARHFRYRTAE
ncbi:MAG: DUF1592 domain-containing protein [Deltaproteobacteria bacterium]|nr:DUF1592 domain-containing protein [Deltaproteobacteria bacterium]